MALQNPANSVSPTKRTPFCELAALALNAIDSVAVAIMVFSNFMVFSSMHKKGC
jgi:hypothetical protein